jgi:hypothetical protein
MIEPATRAILLADSAVAAVVADRVWLGIRPQGERRAGICITRIGGSDPGTLDGSAGYETGTLDVACLAPTYQQAKELAAKAANAMNNFDGGVIAGTNVAWLNVDDQTDIPIELPEGKATPSTYGVSLTTSFMFQQ